MREGFCFRGRRPNSEKNQKFTVLSKQKRKVFCPQQVTVPRSGVDELNLNVAAQGNVIIKEF